jgi:5-methylcytosine-specific restriction endonuclease McrA
MNVRELLPTRRLVPSNKPTGENWSDHKVDLQTDFYFHCGYCGSYDGFRHTYYEVDHFVPKSLFEKNNIITYCQYDNLVYSCKFCNNKKHAKWPSNDETIHNVNNEGFVDPCNADYDNHLKRTEKGSIRWKTDLGKWMVEKGFKFDERDFAIKLLWEINQIRKILDLLADELLTNKEGSDDYNLIYMEMGKMAPKYFLLDKILMNYYNNL